MAVLHVFVFGGMLAGVGILKASTTGHLIFCADFEYMNLVMIL